MAPRGGKGRARHSGAPTASLAAPPRPAASPGSSPQCRPSLRVRFLPVFSTRARRGKPREGCVRWGGGWVTAAQPWEGPPEGFCPTPDGATGGPHSPLTHHLAKPVTYPSIAEPNKASLTRTEPRSRRDTQAERKWRLEPDGNCRRCRSARGSAWQRRRRKEPSAPAPGCGRRAAGRGDGGEGAPPQWPPTRRRAPGALRPLRSGPRPVAEQSGLLGFYCTFLLEVPVALSGRCGWTSTQPSTPTALDLGRVSPGPQDCPKTSSTFPSKAGPNLATVDLDGPRKKLFHSFFLFLLCHLLLTDPSILSKPKTKRNFIPLTKTTA